MSQVAQTSGVNYKWQPISGSAVDVTLQRDTSTSIPHFDVYVGSNLDADPIGSVFRDENPARGWRWRRYGVRELRGGGLNNRDMAVSDLMFNLRQLGKV